MLSATAILSIPTDAPERLFCGAAGEVAKQYRMLAMRWHPDRPENRGSVEADEVFRRIAEFKHAADTLIAAGEWFPFSGEINLFAVDGRRIPFKYCSHRRFDLGHVLVAEDRVAYLVREKFADLQERALFTIKAFRFADDNMKAQFSGQLPTVREAFATRDHRVLIVDKDPEEIALCDLLKHLGGKLPAVHVSWLISRALNLACWLGWAGLLHGDLSAESLFVNPRLHSVSLLGGWWYSVQLGHRLSALPRRSVQLLPSDVLLGKVGDARGDLESIRTLARELLGDAAGAGLRTDLGIPADLATWALQAGGPSALHDFERWPDVLHGAFGGRRFVELPISFSDVYPDNRSL